MDAQQGKYVNRDPSILLSSHHPIGKSTHAVEARGTFWASMLVARLYILAYG